MTTNDPQTSGAVRRLRRRTSDRVIGGVAGGLGDYLNVDPLLIRIGFVGLMIFGGAGLVLYVIAWLLIPHEGSDESTVERLIRRIGMRSRNLVLVALGGLAIYILFWGILPRISDSLGFYVDPAVIWALVVLVLGVLVLRREPPRAAADASVIAPAVATMPPQAAAIPRPSEPAKPRGPLGWYVLSAILAAVGLLAIVQNVAQLDVELGQFFGVALLLLGIGLVIGAWWGHARLLILLGLLLVPLGVTASFITAPLEGGWGEQSFAPTNIQELRPEYRLVGGRLELDLTQLPAGSGPIHIDASVAVGQLSIIVPADATVDVNVAVGGGAVEFLGNWQAGASLTDHFLRDGPGAVFVLNLESGIGEIRVGAADEFGRCIGCDCPFFTSCGDELVPEGY
jgi:phage shock protein PspC (stress-responsive transcriptional regulator)